MEKLHYLYKLTNMNNGKLYIGQTVNPTTRWHSHCYFGKNPEQCGQPISYAINKHGQDNFHFQVIGMCKTYADANELEKVLIKQYDTLIANGKGYNVIEGGNNTPWTEDRKIKMSQLMSGESNPFYGKTHSDETKQKMSLAKKGKPSGCKGSHLTEKAVQVAAIANVGKKQTAETLAKRFSPEARLKMSIAAKARKRGGSNVEPLRTSR